MPRIPVRTEPYTSSTRQHRHFKSKRDLILRTLGKSSYINGSQFVIAWISAKGEVETYASEMLQESVDEVLDLELLTRLAVQVREGADRKREQLEEIQRKRREKGGLLDDQGRVVDEWADMEPAEMASHLLRSAKKAKAERVAAEKARGEEGSSSRAGAPPMTPLRQVVAGEGDMTLVADEEEDVDMDEEDEEEGEEDYEEEPENGALAETIPAPAADPTTAAKTEETEDQGDITLVQHDTPTGESSTGQTPAAHVRHVKVTTTGSPLSLRTTSKAPHSKRGMLMTATPARPTLPQAFATPSGHEAIIAPTPKSGQTSGLMNNVLEGAGSSHLKPMRTAADKTHIPRPLAHVRTPSHAIGALHIGTPLTPAVQTRSITIPYADLVDWYANAFDSLQQATCKLVVKSWIKVIEPRKQSKFPYNRGDDCRPDWWPEHIRHREPDHLQKPERTQILVSLIRSSLAPISKLELSTAEATAYINQPRMKMLRDIYKVAKEDERRRIMGDDVSDIVVNVPASPPIKPASITRMSILDEIAQQTATDVDGARSRRPSNAATEAGEAHQDLASPCAIHPSAAYPTGRHQKAGSIGESVFLGAGAIKKRKLEEMTQGNKENIDPNGTQPDKVAKTRKSAKGQAVRPQSTGAIRKGKQPSKQGPRLSAGFIHPPGSLAMSEIVSPMVQPPTGRPWSTTGARTNGQSSWMTVDTPTNQRQQRLQQLQGQGIVRPMSSDSALSQVGHNMFDGHVMAPSLVGMGHHLSQGILHHPAPAVSGGMDMYLTTDTHGQPQLLPPNVIPVHAGRSGYMQQDPHQGMQYIPYGVPHGMPPFSSVPHQGTYMVYEPNPAFMRTDSTSSSSSLADGRSAQSLGNQSTHPVSRNHSLSTGPPQTYMYPQMTYPVPYQTLYIPAEPHAPNGIHPESQQMMSFTASGMTLLPDEHAPQGRPSVKSPPTVTGRRSTTGSSGSAAGTRPGTSLGMTLTRSGQENLPPTTTRTGFEAGLGDDDAVRSGTSVQHAEGTHASARGEESAHGMMDCAPSRDAAAAGNDHHEQTPGPLVMEPTAPAVTTTEVTEMETVEREFVKFSDGSDRDNFWTHDAL